MSEKYCLFSSSLITFILMKKFCVSILLVLSLLMTPVFAVACEAIDASAHNVVDGKASHDKDGKMKVDHCCCHQHIQADSKNLST
jgi:hypothetical protein